MMSNVNLFLNERNSDLIVEIRNNNPNHVNLLNDIKKIKEKISLSIKDESNLVDKLLEHLSLQSYIEGKYLYVKGIKDCVKISKYIDTGYINENY